MGIWTCPFCGWLFTDMAFAIDHTVHRCAERPTSYDMEGLMMDDMTKINLETEGLKLSNEVASIATEQLHGSIDEDAGHQLYVLKKDIDHWIMDMIRFIREETLASR